MKKSAFFSVVVLFGAFFAQTGAAFAQELTELLPEKSTWSFVTAEPTGDWVTQFPLPNGKVSEGELRTDGNWPEDKPRVWMTTKLTLPKDYTPGNLFLRYRYDDNAKVFINGTLVYAGRGVTRNGWGTQTYTKRIPNNLKPGDNVVAVFCENTAEGGFVFASLLTDGEPALEITPILPIGGEWSCTFTHPGDGWLRKYPLPQSKTVSTPLSTENDWPWDEGDVWMTQEITLPEDFVPEEMIVQYVVDDRLTVNVNGVQVMENVSGLRWKFVRNAKNALKPGRNVIAVRGMNHSRDGLLDIDIFVRKLSDEEK